MAVVPLLVNLGRDLDAMSSDLDLDHLMDDDFGFGIHPLEIFRTPRHHHHHGVLAPSSSSLLSRRRHATPYDRWPLYATRRALRPTPGHKSTAGSDVSPFVGAHGFQVSIDASQFKPNELTVKTVDNSIVVEGRHEEREDEHGLIQRHFIRKYTMPPGYDPKEVVSTISSDGVLTVSAPPPPPPAKAIKPTERIVQIQHTGPAHLSIKPPTPSAAGDIKKDGPVATKSNGDQDAGPAAAVVDGEAVAAK